MAIHMSIRLAWHDSGWNGHICNKPNENTYCVGQYSYPGQLVAGSRDLPFEMNHCGDACKNFPCRVACGLSVNAFGKDPVTVEMVTPDFFKNFDKNYTPAPLVTQLDPYTACTWCYEPMFSDENKTDGKVDNDKRKAAAEAYFKQFEAGKSLIFYYAGYSNPFSENEEKNYVVVGISRLKKLGSFQYYPNVTPKISDAFAGGLVWQMPVTSKYPDEGFCIPYQNYAGDEDKLAKILVKPSNRAPFKYGSREVSNDDAIEVINQLIGAVDALIDFGDTSENWHVRRDWLNSVLAEVWRARGAYPGFPAVLEVLNMEPLISDYVNLTTDAAQKKFVADVRAFVDGTNNSVAQKFSAKDVAKIRRACQLADDGTIDFLFNVAARFDIKAAQIEMLIGDAKTRAKVSVTATVADMTANPYVIFEQYVGFDDDDTIPLYKIDNGVIASPQYALDNLLDVDSPERLRAFCVDELKKIPAHSFVKAASILNAVNMRLDRMPEFKQAAFVMKNFAVDKAVLDEALTQRQAVDIQTTADNSTLYLYLKEIYEDERTVEAALTNLAQRPDIQPKLAVSEAAFKNNLRDAQSPLEKSCPQAYDNILTNQANICMKIFNKPLCVISGKAGTGKTTVIRALLNTITKVHGGGTSFRLLAPTGKASERIKLLTGKDASTIHSFLASNGWINDNFTFKRTGGAKASDVNTIIVDECSMIDLNLFATLLRAINWNSVQRLILIGDPNQLPPIGRGKVFVDIINMLNKNFPDNIAMLTDNVRQLVNQVTGNGCGILKLADVFIQERQRTGDTQSLKLARDEIFNDIQLHGNGDVDKDLAVYFWQDRDDLEKILLDTVRRDLHATADNAQKLWLDTMNANPEAIQVISPYRGEFYGTDSLNVVMQANFKSFGVQKLLDGIGYSDKVIQIVNRPKSNAAYAFDWKTRQSVRAEIFNGEIGMVRQHPFDRGSRATWLERFQVNFSGTTRQGLGYNYGKKLGQHGSKFIPEQKVADNLELAYAISVHKAQGSEFDFVYIVIPQRAGHLLSMELLYTALTRAQKKVTVLLQNDISTLATMSRADKSAVLKINSSVFEFAPLPDDTIEFNGGWYEAGKKIATLSKYFVRSKSEAIIANLLADRDIPFKYEEPLFAPDGTMFLPDFTVKSNGEDFYWEHLGRLDLPEYRAHWATKQAWYNKHFPGKLLTTTESNNLTKDAERIIASL